MRFNISNRIHLALLAFACLSPVVVRAQVSCPTFGALAFGTAQHSVSFSSDSEVASRLNDLYALERRIKNECLDDLLKDAGEKDRVRLGVIKQCELLAKYTVCDKPRLSTPEPSINKCDRFECEGHFTAEDGTTGSCRVSPQTGKALASESRTGCRFKTVRPGIPTLDRTIVEFDKISCGTAGEIDLGAVECSKTVSEF